MRSSLKTSALQSESGSSTYRILNLCEQWDHAIHRYQLKLDGTPNQDRPRYQLSGHRMTHQPDTGFHKLKQIPGAWLGGSPSDAQSEDSAGCSSAALQSPGTISTPPALCNRCLGAPSGAFVSRRLVGTCQKCPAALPRRHRVRGDLSYLRDHMFPSAGSLHSSILSSYRAALGSAAKRISLSQSAYAQYWRRIREVIAQVHSGHRGR